ncbi:ArpU family phage packaging/lysis transcriptional regulator [Paenibacillus lautus]|uniref:ArpU family phage packaging/lysis transcriptional regulator n=1 Tax=Paenibacillus lautus TaxID=1401 RepID=UPI003D2DFA7A
MGQGSFDLPELDQKKTQAAVEEVLEKYRIFKTITFEEREANVTSSISDVPRSFTGTTSDQTGDIAIHNVFVPEMRRSFCERVERAVNKLYPKERLLITERYMKDNRVTDIKMYTFVFNPPMSRDTYVKIRWTAFYSLAFNLSYFKIININDLVRSD